jgi:hypothetical protein
MVEIGIFMKVDIVQFAIAEGYIKEKDFIGLLSGDVEDVEKPFYHL